MSVPVAIRPSTARTPSLKQTGLTVIAGSIGLVLTGLLHPVSGDALLQTDHRVGPVWYVAHLLGVGVWPLAADQPVLAALYDYNTTVNETLADAYQTAIGVAIALLSASLIRERLRSVLGWLGFLSGSAVAITFATGVLSVQAAHFHVFVLVNLVVAAWIASFGVTVAREATTRPRRRSRSSEH